VRLKVVSRGLRSEDTKVIDENGETIDGIASLNINIVAGEVGEVTLVIRDIEVYAEFDRAKVNAKLV
jgi:hypothetical protein